MNDNDLRNKIIETCANVDWIRKSLEHTVARVDKVEKNQVYGFGFIAAVVWIFDIFKEKIIKFVN